MLRTIFFTAAALLALMLGIAALVIYGGLYHVGATRQHFQPVYSLLETAMHNSVRRRASDIVPPPLDNPQLVQRGAACFRDKCVQCHGGPGVAQGDIGKSMQPLPGPLVDAKQHWRAREMYWITRHGIRMSGMPAWEFRLSDEDLWAIVAFMQVLPDLTSQDFARATRASVPICEMDKNLANTVAAGRIPDVQRGRVALYQYACSACHTIPGITGSAPQVGPPLEGLASRTLIAGKLANTRENMVLWLRRTHEVKPLSAMPEMGLTEADAQDIAAYLGTLR